MPKTGPTIPPTEVARCMSTSPAFAATPRRSLVDLATGGRVRFYRKGSYLFHQGDPSEELFFLYEGRVEISALAPSGQRQWLTTVDPPHLLGEIGVLGGSPRTSSGLANEDCLIWLVGGEVFLEFLDSQPPVARALLGALAEQVEAYGALVEDLLFLDLRGRVAKRLVGLVSPGLDEPAEDGTVVPLITHADLASLAGGSRENVSRILSEFQKRGLIRKTGRQYVLTNVKGLLKLASG